MWRIPSSSRPRPLGISTRPPGDRVATRLYVDTEIARQPSSRPAERNVRAIALRLFVTCWLIYGLHVATNSVRELYPALALGDRLSFDVSDYLGLHPDIFEVPGRGAFINNTPGASLLAAVPYALARPVIEDVAARVQRARSTEGDTQIAYRSP